MADIEEYIDKNGERRLLARTQPDESHRVMRASMLNFTDWLRSNGNDLIPESQWREVDNWSQYGNQFINNQSSSSGCTGFSVAQGFMRGRALKGMTFQKLSGAFIYAHINGNRDAGSVITDAMSALMRVGTCLESEFNYPKIYTNQIPASATQTAQRFKVLQAVTLSTWKEIGTAIQMNFIPQFPMQVGSNLERFSSDGVAGYSSGAGNHAVHACGMKKDSSGKWVLRWPNTWGLRFGPFGDGSAFLSQQAVEGADYPNDGFIIVDIQYDPQDTSIPPVPA